MMRGTWRTIPWRGDDEGDVVEDVIEYGFIYS